MANSCDQASPGLQSLLQHREPVHYPAIQGSGVHTELHGSRLYRPITVPCQGWAESTLCIWEGRSKLEVEDSCDQVVLQVSSAWWSEQFWLVLHYTSGVVVVTVISSPGSLAFLNLSPATLLYMARYWSCSQLP